LGALLGFAGFGRILQPTLASSIDNSYGRLPSTPRPWLARLPRVEGPLFVVLVATNIPVLLSAGLAVVLLTRPRTPGGDLSHGIAAGLVAAFVSSFLGGAWTFAGFGVGTTLNGYGMNENSYALKYGQLHPQRRREFPSYAAGIGEYHREVFEPGWLEERYPDLKGLPEEKQREILYDKMQCDALLGVQAGLLLGMPLIFTLLLVVPTLEALAAGALWRRYQRPWPVVAAYAECVVPLALSLIFAATVSLSLVVSRDIFTGDWFGKAQRGLWQREVLLAALILVQVATWRGWRWWLRLALHVAWVALAVLTIVVESTRG
jgi:hypothetical protein